MIPLALLLAALPCGGLNGFQRSVAADAASHGWPATLAEREPTLAPLQLDPPPSPALDAKTGPAWLTKQVSAACAAQALASPSRTPDRARLEQILGRHEFSSWHGKKAAQLGWFDRLLRHFFRWLIDLMGSSGTETFADWTRTAVLIAAFLVIAFAAYRLLREKRKRPQRAPKPGPAVGPFVLGPPEDHLAAARAALTNDPREAIRQGLLALLSSLERRRLARPDRVKTNREIVSELPARGAAPELVQEIAPLIQWFDARFYSLGPVPEDGALHFLDQVAALEARFGAAR